jgi:hypothetical protein
MALNHSRHVLGTSWTQRRHNPAVLLIDEDEKLAKVTQIRCAPLKFQTCTGFSEQSLATRKVTPNRLHLGPRGVTQRLHRRSIKLPHGMRRTVSTDPRKLTTRHDEVSKERASRATQLTEDPDHRAVVVRLRADGQVAALQPGSIRLQQLRRQVGWFRNSSASRALLPKEGEKLPSASEGTLACDAPGGIMVAAERSGECAEQMREIVELAEVEGLWKPARLVVEPNHNRLYVRVRSDDRLSYGVSLSPGIHWSTR